MPSVAEQIVAYARGQLGDPYVWGGEGPNGFDCSGLVFAAYKAAGLDVQRTTAANLGKQGNAVPLEQAKPGDLVYYDWPGATDHVAIVSGQGTMIEAPKRGVPVREVPIRPPTSIRRLPQVGNGPIKGRLYGGGFDITPGFNMPGPSDVVDGVAGVFAGWQNSLQNIALKVTAGAAVVGLVVVGARTALADKGTS